MATTLQTYITQVQRLLHDQNASFWPVAELTDYINEGRNRIAQDSKCLRALQTGIVLTAGQELYPIATTLPAVSGQVIDILGISVYYGSTRYKCNYLPFTAFDAQVRSWSQQQERPVIFTRMGATQVYLGPVPDQAYVTDWDVAIVPTPMVLTSDVETIPAPFQEPVQHWAAYKAKFKEQSFGEAQMFKAEYANIGRMSARAFMTRVVPNPYAWP